VRVVAAVKVKNISPSLRIKLLFRRLLSSNIQSIHLESSKGIKELQLTREAAQNATKSGQHLSGDRRGPELEVAIPNFG